MKTLQSLVLATIVAIALVVESCAPPPFVARSTMAPEIKYCNDATGHKIGAVPFPLGGTCTCTPTRMHYQRCLQERTIAAGMTYGEFLDLYTSRGLKTDLDHKGCNNMCADGPNVVFGGKCMATPTPGTLNYERVVSGNSILTMGTLHNEEHR